MAKRQLTGFDPASIATSAGSDFGSAAEPAIQLRMKYAESESAATTMTCTAANVFTSDSLANALVAAICAAQAMAANKIKMYPQVNGSPVCASLSNANTPTAIASPVRWSRVGRDRNNR